MNLALINISKYYNKSLIIEGINLLINDGEVWGIIGRNGVGKTTLMNIMSNIIYPSSGEIWFDTVKINNDFPIDVKKKIGSCSNEDLIEDFNGYEFLHFRAELFGIKKKKELIEQLVVYLFESPEEIKKTTIKNFSFGMKKKLSIIASLLHKPQIIFWDEPFSGLDPISIRKVVALIDMYKKGDNSRVFIISSHDLGIIEKICSHVAVLKFGKLVFNGSMKQLIDSTPNIDAGIVHILDDTHFESSNLDLSID